MPPTRRRTANIKHFNYALIRELSERGHRRTPYDEIPSRTWASVLQATANHMFGDEHVAFYSNGDDGREVVTDPKERGAKLARFLKRTINTQIPHLTVSMSLQENGCPWFGAVAGAAPPGDGEPTPEGGGDGEPGPGQPDAPPDGEADVEGAEDSDAEGEAEAKSPQDMTPEELEQHEVSRLSSPPPSPHGDEFAKWWRILASLRKYCRESAQHGLPIDDLESYRPGVMGAAMIREGLTADACADACTAHWPDDAREELGIMVVPPESVIAPIDGHHPALPYMVRLMKAGVPVMLHGGAGVGKTTLARDVAEMFGMSFGMVSMTAGLSTTALTGSVNLQGFVTRPCIDTFVNGGLFLFDELDAADPNLLLVCNTMLANGEFQSPVTGERHFKHPKWYPIAAVNTLNGATTSYTGRSRLDHATMDRWRMGRIRVGFNIDQALQYSLAALQADA